MAPSGLGGLRSALTPVDSCARAHLTTVVLRQLGLRHGPRRWGSKSCLRRSQIVSFDLWLRDSKRKSRTDFHLLFVGETHTHSSPFRNASAPVSVLCSKLEDVDVNILLAGRLSSSTGHTVGVILLGRCAGLEVFRLVVGRRLSNRVANGQRRFRIQVNVTAEQAQLLKMRAAVEGVSVSRVVVDSLFKPVESGEIDAAALRESVVLLREYRRKLEGATTNLNQIAKHANTVSQVPANFGDVVRRLEEVTDEVNDLLLKVRIN